MAVREFPDVRATVELVRGGGLDPVVERPVIQGPWCFQAQVEDWGSGDVPMHERVLHFGSLFLPDAVYMDMRPHAFARVRGY